MAKHNAPTRGTPGPTAPARAGVTLGTLFAKAGLVAAAPKAPETPKPGASSFVEASEAPSATEQQPPVARDLGDVPRLVVRRERKGHAGHTATVIEGLVEAGVDAGAVAKQLKHVLGCGASIDGGDLVLLGDVVDRAATWLEKQGVRRVVRGS